MSKHREQHIIDTAACPRCGAATGELCRDPEAGGRAGMPYQPGAKSERRLVVHGDRRRAWQRFRQYDDDSGPGPIARSNARVVVWFSRHDPIARQREELARLFPHSRLILDHEAFATADDVLQRFAAAGGDEMVIVAPLSVAQALIERGIRPLWPAMEMTGPEQGEVTMRRRDGRVHHYRFIRFRRLVAIDLCFEDL